MAAEKTDQVPKIISCSLHLVMVTFPVPWAAFQSKRQEQFCLEPGLEAEQHLETKLQEGLNRKNFRH